MCLSSYPYAFYAIYNHSGAKLKPTPFCSPTDALTYPDLHEHAYSH